MSTTLILAACLLLVVGVTGCGFLIAYSVAEDVDVDAAAQARARRVGIEAFAVGLVGTIVALLLAIMIALRILAALP